MPSNASNAKSTNMYTIKPSPAVGPAPQVSVGMVVAIILLALATIALGVRIYFL